MTRGNREGRRDAKAPATRGGGKARGRGRAVAAKKPAAHVDRDAVPEKPASHVDPDDEVAAGSGVSETARKRTRVDKSERREISLTSASALRDVTAYLVAEAENQQRDFDDAAEAKPATDGEGSSSDVEAEPAGPAASVYWEHDVTPLAPICWQPPPSVVPAPMPQTLQGSPKVDDPLGLSIKSIFMNMSNPTSTAYLKGLELVQYINGGDPTRVGTICTGSALPEMCIGNMSKVSGKVFGVWVNGICNSFGCENDEQIVGWIKDNIGVALIFKDARTSHHDMRSKTTLK